MKDNRFILQSPFYHGCTTWNLTAKKTTRVAVLGWFDLNDDNRWISRFDLALAATAVCWLFEETGKKKRALSEMRSIHRVRRWSKGVRNVQKVFRKIGEWDSSWGLNKALCLSLNVSQLMLKCVGLDLENICWYLQAVYRFKLVWEVEGSSNNQSACESWYLGAFLFSGKYGDKSTTASPLQTSSAVIPLLKLWECITIRWKSIMVLGWSFWPCGSLKWRLTAKWRLVHLKVWQQVLLLNQWHIASHSQ